LKGLAEQNLESYAALYAGRDRGGSFEAVNKARIARSLLRALPQRRGLRALDVGFGWGTCLARLERDGLAPVGLEPVAAAARAAARRLRRSRLVVGHAERLPFAGERFDVVVCSHVLEHLAEPGRAAAELARVLRPGGWAVVGVPGPGLLDHPLHYRSYDLESLARDLEPLQEVRALRRGAWILKLAGRAAPGGRSEDGGGQPSLTRWLARPLATLLLRLLAPLDDLLARWDDRPEEVWLLARKPLRP